MNLPFRLFASAALSAVVAGCALFSTTPAPQVVAEIHRRVQPGMSVDAARSALADLGFACLARRGDFRDESGHEHVDVRFLDCTRRPGVVSMACANRDRVVVVPDAGGPVTTVAVDRGPHCSGP